MGQLSAVMLPLEKNTWNRWLREAGERNIPAPVMR